MKVTTTPKNWNSETDIYNGDPASIDKLDVSSNSVWARRICIASGAWDLSNAPSLYARTWTANTVPERDTALKIRADIPTFLQGVTYYGSAIAKTRIVAKVILYNSAAEAGYVDSVYLYSGDYSDTTKQAYAATTNKIYMPALGLSEVNLIGYIAPGYRDGSAITDTDPNYLFLDASSLTTATPKILYLAVYLEPISGIDDSGNILIPMTHNASIEAQDVSDYRDRLIACRDSYGAFVPGSMGPVDQSTTGSGNLGFGLNAYYATRTYHCFMPNTVYNSTSDTRGSLWVPLEGKWTLCSDGNYRVVLDVSLHATSTTATISATYYFTGFLASSTAGFALDTLATSLTQNVTKQIYKRITYVSASPLDGIAVCPRVLRSGATGNYWIYHNLFSVKVFPY